MANAFAIFDLAAGASVFVLLIALVILVFEVAMFVSVIRNKQITDNARILWAVGMILVHPFIAIAYYFTDYQKTKNL